MLFLIFFNNLNITNKPAGSYLHKRKAKYTTTKQLNIQFNGSFHQIAGFLNALERTQPVMIVNDFHIARVRAGEEYPSGYIELIIIVESPDKS